MLVVALCDNSSFLSALLLLNSREVNYFISNIIKTKTIISSHNGADVQIARVCFEKNGTKIATKFGYIGNGPIFKNSNAMNSWPLKNIL